MICFAWDGFPQYAARCVGAFVRTSDESVVVVATRPAVPIMGMEGLCNCPIHWISPDGPFNLSTLQLSNRSTLFVSGWFVPTFNRLAADVRAKGGRVIAMLDNNYDVHGMKAWCREALRALRFRILHRRQFDGYFVPGKSARRLLRFWGVPDDRIVEGIYAADGSLFTKGPALKDRPKKIIYVGQLCERKNVRRLVEAFLRVQVECEGEQRWELHLYGSGPLKEEIAQTLKDSKTQTIHLHDFLQPEELAEKYRESRIFVLPSVEEHWGLVVHEAALSGCVLLLSNRVGAADDLLEEGVNGLTFDPFDVNDMAETLKAAMMRQFDTKTAAEKAREHGVDGFVAAMRGLKG